MRSPAAARKGYDHKAMAHHRQGRVAFGPAPLPEMGVDVQTDPIRVVGCGDMSGDVFGNGMLLSQTLKLVAAFDHRHIFLDPDPDPAASWDERARLFALPRSSWADYDRALISAGGGVFPRSLKAIPLSPAIQRGARASRRTALDPETLIRAILKSPVDLLWFGGIGTYVKAAAREQRDRRRSRQRRASASTATEVRAQGDRRGRQPGLHPGRPHRVRAGRRGRARRPDQHRFHRQFGRRRLLGQRGQHQDRARRGQARRARSAKTAASNCSAR